MNDAVSFRLTFNLPAEKYFFDGEEVAGIRIKIENGRIFFKPVQTVRRSLTEAQDGTIIGEVAFTSRPRGGKEAVIDGIHAKELLDILAEEASFQHPFFRVKRAKDDRWVTIQHHDEPTAPPKFEPHMRVWFPASERSKAGVRSSLMNDEITDALGEFVDTIRCARDIVQQYDSERRIGRPPKEVLESRVVLDQFSAFAMEILPSLPAFNNHESLAPIQHAATLLNEFMRANGMLETAEQPTINTSISEPAKRGRPRKVQPTVELNDDDELELEPEAPPPIKRGPGRPRKVQPALALEDKQEIVTVKRGPGRPRKVQPVEVASDEDDEEADNLSEDAEPQIKRYPEGKRGIVRPRGVIEQPVQTEADQEDTEDPEDPEDQEDQEVEAIQEPKVIPDEDFVEIDEAEDHEVLASGEAELEETEDLEENSEEDEAAPAPVVRQARKKKKTVWKTARKGFQVIRRRA